MKSTTGEHFLALDHVRALAAFMVFMWHFAHSVDGHPVPFHSNDWFMLSIFSEGHTGVALFMTLSGYLFAKIIGGRDIRFLPFLFNRAVRLLPLLVLVILAAGVMTAMDGGNVRKFASKVLTGLVRPTLPNGGWSITVEFHFYLALPLLLMAARRSRKLLLALVAAAVLVRLALYGVRGEIQSLSYWTIIGRIDQFILGMTAYGYRHWFKGRHLVALAGFVAFTLFYHAFDRAGGFYNSPSYPSPSALWVVMPTIEGLFYCCLIAYYDSSFQPRNRGFSRFLGAIGSYSYSIYLLHFFVVFKMARLLNEKVANLSDLPTAMLFGSLCFLAVAALGWASFTFIESPFLRLRRPYIKKPVPECAPVGGESAVHGASAV